MNLAMLKRHQFRIIRGADDFIVSSVSGGPPSWDDFVARQTLGVTDCIVLPGSELDAIHRAFQNPVPRPRGIGSFNDDIGNLKDLKQRKSQSRISMSSTRWPILQELPCVLNSPTHRHRL